MTSDFCVAVHGLVFLNHKAAVLSSETLAENICTNPARVRKVMAKLKRAGLVETHEGAQGGYRFPLDPAQVSLARVADALEVTYISPRWHSGNTDMDCLIASGMGAVMDEVFGDLNEVCRRRLEDITLAWIDSRLFGGKQNGG